MTHRRRIAIPILILSAAVLAPAAALAGPPLPPGTIVGTPDADVLHGTPGPDLIFAFAGPDTIYGGWGADRIFAGPGDDGVRGGPGPDTIRGGLGEDRIASGAGNDLVLVAGDGSIDKVWCGDGRMDLAIVDPDDEIANDCEFVWARDPES